MCATWGKPISVLQATLVENCIAQISWRNNCLSDDLAGIAITFHQGTFESIPSGPSRGLSEYKEVLYLWFFG